MAKPVPVTVSGVQYKSIRDMCQQRGYSYAKISTRMNRARMSLEEALTAEDRYRGNKRHPNYGPWTAMRNRCTRPDYTGYENYGAAGITVCERWMNDFWAFVSDVGVRPSRMHTIDRIENSKGYFPGNCRWATKREQSLNKRNNVFIAFNGETLCAKDWARRLGIDDATLSWRLKNWPLARALSQAKLEKLYEP